MTRLEYTTEELQLAANTVRMLSADAVEKANSGHPGMPMGAADYGVVLWLKYLRFNPEDPRWPARDRFVLSNGHGSAFLYSMLHLSGYSLSLDDLKAFRQWESKTPGHPESFMTPGVEATTGPLGQGISNAVGMALGQKIMAARYNDSEHPVLDHRVFCFAGDGCLMEGISSEASSLAGHLGLGNLVVLYDDNHISIAGRTDLAFSEDVLKRYEAYGWHTQRVDGHDFAAVDQAISAAIGETKKPSIIACRTIIGKGAPHKADDSEVHGSPLGADELKAAKKELGLPADQMFYVPSEVKQTFARRLEELREDYKSWQTMFAGWKKKSPEKATAFDKQLKLSAPANLQEKLLSALPKEAQAASTRKLSGIVLQKAAAEVSALIGGSADLEPSTLTLIKDSTDVTKDSFSGINIRFGVREHGMAAIMNGLAYYGGFIPFGSTFLCFADYMRPSIRLAALSHLPSLFIFTHDSVFLGEDGPTHQPIEHINALRIMPNLHVFRPADGVETAVCYSLALQRHDGPSALLFSRQNLEPIARPSGSSPTDVAKGAYTVFESESDKTDPEIVIVATGSEVPLAIDAAKKLGSNPYVRVVSMPCYEIFRQQPVDYRNKLIPPSAKKVVVEAGCTFGWATMLDTKPSEMLLIGIDRFGASAPAKVIAQKMGFTSDSIVSRIKDAFSV